MSGLILETSTEKGCIVLSRNGAAIASHPLLGGPELSKTLALEVDALLKKNSFSPEFIAVGTGPGSYTGIRVGAALSKALAFGWSIPLFGFCSLEAYGPDAVVVDARIKGFYLLKNSLHAPILLPADEAHNILSGLPKIASPHPETIRKRLPLLSQIVETSPDPSLLAAIGRRLFLQGNPASLLLSY
jgi:tRNA threonylcarbamoyl adenosine modification protein YeaZ